MKYHLSTAGARLKTLNDIGDVHSFVLLQYENDVPADAENVGLIQSTLETEDGEPASFHDVTIGKTYLLFVKAKYKVLRHVEYTYEMVEASPSPLRRGASGMLETPEKVLIAKAKMIYHEEPKWLTHDYRATYELSVAEEE